MTYDMEDFLKSCIQRYLEVGGKNVTLRNYATPFLAENHRDSIAGGPEKGSCARMSLVQTGGGAQRHLSSIHLVTKFQ